MNDTSKTELDAQLKEKVIKLLSRDDGGFFKGYTIYKPRIDELVSFIAQREQAAELRGGIKALKKAQGRYIVEHKSEDHPEFIKGWNGHRSHMSKELAHLTDLQATKPEKGEKNE